MARDRKVDVATVRLWDRAVGAVAWNAERGVGEYGYEQAMSVIQQINLGHPAVREMFRRMVFNVVARNQDDHTRNIAFLLNSAGKWRLAPAFDMVWAYNAQGAWTNRHQMSVNGKRDHFTRADLLTVAKAYHIKDAEEILDHVIGTVADWKSKAKACGVDRDLIKTIAATHRLNLR